MPIIADEVVERPEPAPFLEAFLYWLKLGFISFGGPAGQISMMHQELVEKSADGYLNIASCMRSITQWFCRGPKPSNWQPISAG